MMDNQLETKLPTNRGPNWVVSLVWELIQIALLALIVIVPVRTFVAEPFIVSGKSMLPNFHDKEYLIIDKLSYRFSEPERGEVLVLKFPKNESEYFIKRVIGLPGDTLKFDKGSVYISNAQNPEPKRLSEKYLPVGLLTTASPELITLKSEEYFVMGDNREYSSDSRSWGVLPKRDIVGKVVLRMLPVSKFQVFSYTSPLN